MERTEDRIGRVRREDGGEDRVRIRRIIRQVLEYIMREYKTEPEKSERSLMSRPPGLKLACQSNNIFRDYE